MLVHLYKRINGKLELIDFGFSKFTKSYEKQGYRVVSAVNKSGVSKRDTHGFIIHHIHSGMHFNLRSMLNNLICKFIPKRFLNY